MQSPQIGGNLGASRQEAEDSIATQGLRSSPRVDSDALPAEVERELSRLRFDDPAIEAEFLALITNQGPAGFRIGMVIGMVSFLAWALMDLQLVPEYVKYSWPIRFGLGVPMFALALAASFTEWFQRRLYRARAAIGLLSGLIMVACSTVTGVVGHQHYLGGLMSYGIFSAVYPGQRFRISSASIWLVYSAYLLAMYFDPDASFVVRISNTIFLVATNLTAMVVAYAIERFSRTTFMQRRIIIEQSDALFRAMRDAERAAITDPLTGLYNRRHFFGEAARGDGRVSVIILDVDHFKSINDRFGHATGDQVLRGVSDRVREGIRPNDVACRYGGEEFAVLLPDSDLPTSAAVGERLRRQIEAEPFSFGNKVVHVTVSVGVASVHDRSPGIETLLDRADRALYEAKNGGRNRVKLWNNAVVAREAN